MNALSLSVRPHFSLLSDTELERPRLGGFAAAAAAAALFVIAISLETRPLAARPGAGRRGGGRRVGVDVDGGGVDDEVADGFLLRWE